MGDYPLSAQEIKATVNCPIMSIREFQRYTDLFQAMRGKNCLIILYETKKEFGHWVCILIHPATRQMKPRIEFFDSLGYFPDHERIFVDKNFKKLYFNSIPHIVKLLRDKSNQYIIEYNNHQLQGDSSSTCGRWVILRILLSDLSLEQFTKYFKQFKNPDDEVLRLSQEYGF